MRVVERIGDLNGMSQDLIGRQRAAGQAVSDRLALQQLHHDVVATVLLADVMQRADVRVIQTRNGSSLHSGIVRGTRRGQPSRAGAL